MLDDIPVRQKDLLFYRTSSGRVPFQDWYFDLRDKRTRAVINARLERLQYGGHAGKVEPVGDGVFELKIYFGPGYRIYFGQENRRVVVVLCGGDKDSQVLDIERAKHYWLDYRRKI